MCTLNEQVCLLWTHLWIQLIMASSILTKDWWKHIYKCHMMNLKHKYGFVQLCFSCNVWFTNSAEWNKHCQEHVNWSKTLPLQCDLLVFHYTLVCLKLCFFCLSNSTLTASQQMCQFTTWQKWQQHVYKHVQKAIKLIICKHLQCEIVFNSNQNLIHHLKDIHHVKFTKTTKRQQLKFNMQSIDWSAKRLQHTPLNKSLHNKLSVQIKKQSGSAEEKAEFRFFNYNLNTFKPDTDHSCDTSLISIFFSELTQTETPATFINSQSSHNIDSCVLNAWAITYLSLALTA